MLLERSLGDIRYAWRRLRHDSATAVVAIASIALGVGVSTAIFGAVDRILLAGLPYPDAERVVVLTDRDDDGEALAIAYGSFLEIAARNRSFEALAVADEWQPSLVAAGEPERLAGDLVTPGYFAVLGVNPAVGRGFVAADDVAGTPKVAIVSAAFALRRFGSASAALEQPLSLDGESYIVVGVLPREFENVLRPAVEIWAPLRFRAQPPLDGPEWGHQLRMVGRLRAGLSLEGARNDVGAIASSPTPEFARAPWASLARGLTVDSLQASVTREVRPALLAILGAVVLLLAIACANVTNILLARGVARRAELAVRSALGAGQSRLVRQLFAECALVAVLGGALGIGVAAATSRILVALAPADLPRLGALGLDARVLVLAVLVTTAVTLVVGLVPALRARELGAHSGLAAGGRVTPPGLLVLRRSLVIAQVALATVLLASAGLLLRSVDRVLDTPAGFDAERLVALQVVASGQRRSNDELRALYERALDAVRAVPGVERVALTSQLPLSGDSDAYGVQFESLPGPDAAGSAGAFRYVVTPAWFETLQVPLKRGRLFGAEDRTGAAPAVLVSESFAARRFGARDPIGERVRIGPDISRPDLPWRTVVGVVGDVKQASLTAGAPDAFYVPMGQWIFVDAAQWLVVGTAGEPASFVEAIKRAVWSVDATLPIERITPLPELVAGSESQRTFALTIFAAFGLVALLLAGVGVYGVIGGRVAERTREIGLRAALGATPVRLAALVVSQGLVLAAIGIAVGGGAAIAATRALASLLFGVGPFDALTYAAVAALLLGVSFLACYAPAFRAARVDPALTLRAE